MEKKTRLFNSWEEAGLHFHANGKQIFNIRCPFCADDRKSHNQKLQKLNINLTNNTFRCAHCLENGRIKTMGEYIQPEYKKTIVLPTPKNHTGLNDAALEWFVKERYIGQKTLNHFGVYSDTMWHHSTRENEQVVVLPYMRRGTLINRKFRFLHEKDFRHDKDAELIFFNIDVALDKKTKEVIITEGELGALLWHEAGYENVISVPNGVNISKEEVAHYKKHNVFLDQSRVTMEYLDTAYDDLQHIETFHIAVDDDVPGRKLRKELIRRLGAERCRIITFKGYKDEGDLVQATGNRMELIDCFKQGKEVPLEGIKSAEDEDVWNEMLEIYDKGLQKGLRSGIPEMDPHYKFRLRELDIITGLPNDGKTTFIVWLMCLTAVKFGWKWGIYCPESVTPAQLLNLMVACLRGRPTEKGNEDRMSKGKFIATRHFIKEHFFIVDSNQAESLDRVMERFQMLVRRKGVNACLLDPWNDIVPTLRKGETELMYLQRQLSEIRKFKDVNDLKFYINAHPINLRYKEGENPPVAKASDISGGGLWFAKADNILTVYRHRNGDPYCTLTEIHVSKIKHRELVGMLTPPESPIMLDFNIKTRRFEGAKSRKTMPELPPIYNPDDQKELPLEPKKPYAPPPVKTFADDQPPLLAMTKDGRQLIHVPDPESDSPFGEPEDAPF